MERGRAARERHGVLDAHDGRELRLERVDLRPERRDPADAIASPTSSASRPVTWGGER